MNKDLKNEISSLEEEIAGLKFTVNEQKLLIEDLRTQLKEDAEDQDELPSEIQILKEMYTSQRREVIQRDNQIDELNNQIDNLEAFKRNIGTQSGEELNNEERISTQRLIVQLTDENEEYKEKLNILQTQLEKRPSIESTGAWEFDEENEENIDFLNLKQLNIQLMEVNGLLRVEVESLKSQLGVEIEEENSGELELANNKIEILVSELQDYEAQVKYLQEKLEQNESRHEEDIVDLTQLKDELLKTQLRVGIEEENSGELELAHNKIEILKSELQDYESQVKHLHEKLEQNESGLPYAEEDINDLTQLKHELLEYQKQNLVLNDMAPEFKDIKPELEESGKHIQDPDVYTIPQKIPLSLFYRIYNLLNERQKKFVRSILLEDLNSDYREVKRDAIKILTQIKDVEIYEAFTEMIHDKDWIVRLYIIKALSKFENKHEDLIDLMKELSKDADVDVRELAVKVLYNITND